MNSGDFAIKSAINFVLWMLTFVVIGYGIPTIFVVFGDGSSRPTPIDFQALADVRILLAQCAAAALGLLISFVIQPQPLAQPNQPANANPGQPVGGMPTAPIVQPAPPAAQSKSIPQLLREEFSSVCINFGSLSLLEVIVFWKVKFLIAVAACYYAAYRLK